MENEGERKLPRFYASFMNEEIHVVSTIERAIAELMMADHIKRGDAVGRLIVAGAYALLTSETPEGETVGIGMARTPDAIKFWQWNLERKAVPSYARAAKELYEELGAEEFEAQCKQRGIESVPEFDIPTEGSSGWSDQVGQWLAEYLKDGEQRSREEITNDAIRAGVIANPLHNPDQYKKDISSFAALASRLGLSGGRRPRGMWSLPLEQK